MLEPYYQDDSITIYHGDCREWITTLPVVDHVITDPPYSEQTHDGALSHNGSLARTAENRGEWTRKTVEFAPIDLDELRAIYSNISFRRWLVAFMDYHHVVALEKEPPALCRSIRFAVWVKGAWTEHGFFGNPTPQFSGDRPGQGWEAIGIMHRDEGKLRWNGGGRTGVFMEPKVQTEHATAKPIKLMRRLVDLFTDPGDLILDPFMGSGTTLRAAKELGRRAIGIEKDEKYCKAAADWMRQELLPLVPRAAKVKGNPNADMFAAVAPGALTPPTIRTEPEPDDGGPLGDS